MKNMWSSKEQIEAERRQAEVKQPDEDCAEKSSYEDEVARKKRKRPKKKFMSTVKDDMKELRLRAKNAVS